MVKYRCHLLLITAALITMNAMNLFAQSIPASYSNLSWNEDGKLSLKVNDTLTIVEASSETWLMLQNLQGNPKGTNNGIVFDFNNSEFNGSMYYGFIAYGDSRHPQPVYFYSTAKIENGKTHIVITKKMAGKFDMIGWEKSGKGTIGYRILDKKGRFLYDGRISFKGTGPFEIDSTITEGPFVNILKSDGATLSFKTNVPLRATIEVDNKLFKDVNETQNHEIQINGLAADTCYTYTVKYGQNSQQFEFHTAPLPGSRKSFTFAYASDSRAGQGGGERNIYGANFYMMKKIMALNSYKNVRFMQFTGDLINGYLSNAGQMDLQYANWKRSVQPFMHYFPVIATMGNHEAFIHQFRNGKDWYAIDKFSYDTNSAEAIFAKNFVNPVNGPDSEDGTGIDPDKGNRDFPSYKENVFFYTYDNVAMIVLNSNYWFAPSIKKHPITSGNLHGYIMDNQLSWLKMVITKLEKNNNIDHAFITVHTPLFPNGGHVKSDMWYGGSNKPRAIIAGKPVEKGIIERRDELLDVIINQNSKVRAILTGDEHNYCRTEVGPKTEIYPPDYDASKIKLNRTIWQVNNGSAGAPYYAQEKTPWTNKVKGFTTQNVVVYFHVNGKKIEVEIQNPDTLEPVEEFVLTK